MAVNGNSSPAGLYAGSIPAAIWMKQIRSTKLYCLRKGNLYVAWDGIRMVEKPHEGIRVSRTHGERKYPDYELISFPEAYDQWYRALKERQKA